MFVYIGLLCFENVFGFRNAEGFHYRVILTTPWVFQFMSIQSEIWWTPSLLNWHWPNSWIVFFFKKFDHICIVVKWEMSQFENLFWWKLDSWLKPKMLFYQWICFTFWAMSISGNNPEYFWKLNGFIFYFLLNDWFSCVLHSIDNIQAM